MTEIILFVLLGLAVGMLSGIVGIGGGIVLIPVLILFFGFTQKEAQGTTLAILLLPIGALAVYNYYRYGYINFKVAGLISCGFFVGGYLGSRIAVHLTNEMLSRIFGVALLIIAIYMILKK